MQIGNGPRVKDQVCQLWLAPLFQKSLIIFSDHFFFILDIFLSAALKGWKKSIGFTDKELYTDSFKRKSFKKANILEARQTLKILDVVISSHIISFVNFQTLPNNSEKPKSINLKQKY